MDLFFFYYERLEQPESKKPMDKRDSRYGRQKLMMVAGAGRRQDERYNGIGCRGAGSKQEEKDTSRC